jgi:hypothetical protein
MGAGNPLAVVVKNEFTVVVGVEIQIPVSAQPNKAV